MHLEEEGIYAMRDDVSLTIIIMFIAWLLS